MSRAYCQKKGNEAEQALNELSHAIHEVIYVNSGRSAVMRNAFVYIRKATPDEDFFKHFDCILRFVNEEHNIDVPYKIECKSQKSYYREGEPAQEILLEVYGARSVGTGYARTGGWISDAESDWIFFLHNARFVGFKTADLAKYIQKYKNVEAVEADSYERKNRITGKLYTRRDDQGILKPDAFVYESVEYLQKILPHLVLQPCSDE